MLICFEYYKTYIHILNRILDLAGSKQITLKIWNNNTCCLSYKPNTVPTDALATLWARASAGMVLTPKAIIFRHHTGKDAVL